MNQKYNLLLFFPNIQFLTKKKKSVIAQWNQKVILEKTFSHFEKNQFIEKIVLFGKKSIINLFDSPRINLQFFLPRSFFFISFFSFLFQWKKLNALAKKDKQKSFIFVYGNSCFLKQGEIKEAIQLYEQRQQKKESDVVFFYGKKEKKIDEENDFKNFKNLENNRKNSFVEINNPFLRDSFFSREEEYSVGNLIFFKNIQSVKKNLFRLFFFENNKNKKLQKTEKLKELKKIKKVKNQKSNFLQNDSNNSLKDDLNSNLSDNLSYNSSLLLRQKVDFIHTEKYGILNKVDSKEKLKIFREQNKKKVTKKNILVVVNGKAGEGPKFLFHFYGLIGLKRKQNIPLEKLKKKIIRYFSFYHQQVEIQTTQKKSHGTKLAKQAVEEKRDIVVVVGGDGSINEVVNGLVGSEVALGVIPFGTANVFGIQMKIDSSIPLAIQKIIEGKRKKIDVGKINERYFCCMAGAGMDAMVVKGIKDSWKKYFGAFSYVIAIYNQLFSFYLPKIKVTFYEKENGEEKSFQETCYSFLIGNVKYYAGNLKLFKDAKMTDGKLNFVLLKKRSILSILYFFFLSKIKKKKFSSKNIRLVTCEKAEVKSKHPVAIQTDGDYIGETPVKIKTCKKKLMIIY